MTGIHNLCIRRRAGRLAGPLIVALLAMIAPAKSASVSEPLTKLQFYTISDDIDALPKPVSAMWDTIASAAATGDIEAMRLVLESSELLPQIDRQDTRHPIDIWKDRSVDGSGRDITAAMLNILEAGYAHINQGKPHELYVWPSFAVTGTRDLAPDTQILLYRIAPAKAVAKMLKTGVYSGYRLGISPDGTWQFFLSGLPSARQEE